MSSSPPLPQDESPERLIGQFLREVPFLPSARDLAIVTSPVSPWPHQLEVVRRTVGRYPQSFLFADEVGLGKTVEAALTLRSLWLSGRVRRALILVPKAVLRQWQEELHEKAVLNVPIFDGRRFVDVFGRETAVDLRESNIWDRRPLFLASTQLARTQKRRLELWRSKPWDLVIVDEAHHARRRSSGSADVRRPNRLLELLAGSSAQPGGLAARARCLYLLTATPMQIHPVEVWDLLKLLGLGGRWGARSDSFVSFFEQMRRPFEERDWGFLGPFVEEVRHGASAPTVELIEETFVHDRPLRDLNDKLRSWTEGQRKELDELLQRSAPIRSMVWRNTRGLLRRYHRSGLLDRPVPERRPRNIWIRLSAEERRLYDQIEDYLCRFYQRYEQRRNGLGFVMTVYRRRLTSSFHAIDRSLSRRLDILRGERRPPAPEWGEALDLDSSDRAELDPEELDPEELGEGRQSSLFEPDSLPTPSRLSRDEVAYLREFLDDLKALPSDSKLERLKTDLEELLDQRDRILVFTQYLDTLDYLRDALRETWRVACYSGRGGEMWHADHGWVGVGKEELKRDLAEGRIEILLCTEAAGEGLNLQTCGVLINYDMPWNPMKVEQRIGRIDRIGQHYDEVWILNYFYEQTVEAVIYQRLAHRIDWFQAVLGELQPILHGVGEAIHELALTPRDKRRRALEESLGRLQRNLDDRPPDVVAPGAIEPAEPEPCTNPVPAEELEAAALACPSLASGLTPLGEGVYELTIDGRSSRVTFRRELFAERPYSLMLLTWGVELFDRWLAALPAPDFEPEPTGLGLYQTLAPAPVSVFLRPGKAGSGDAVRTVESLDDLRRLLEDRVPAWSRSMEGQASSVFSQSRRAVLRGQSQVEAARRADDYRAIASAAAQTLQEAAWVDLARAEKPGLFDRPVELEFGAEAVLAQGRHGSPFDALLERLGASLPTVSQDDLGYGDIRKLSREALDDRRRELAAEGQKWLERWRRLEAADEAARQEQRELGLSGLLERRYFPLPGGEGFEADPMTEMEVPLSDLKPFENAVPCWLDAGEAATWVAPGEDIESAGLQDLATAPELVTWVRPNGRRLPGPDLFVLRWPDRSLEPRIESGGLLLLKVEPRPPRPGDLVLVQHPRLVDEVSGSDVLVRIWSPGADRGAGGSETQQIQLLRGDGAPSLTLEEEEIFDLRVLAFVVEVLG